MTFSYKNFNLQKSEKYDNFNCFIKNLVNVNL